MRVRTTGLLGVAGAVYSAINCAALFTCDPVVLNDVSYDLSKLSGVHTIEVKKSTPPSQVETTWFVSPCGEIGTTKDKSLQNECPKGSQICGVTQLSFPDSKQSPVISEVIPVAGDIAGDKTTQATVAYLVPDNSTPEDAPQHGLSGVEVVYHGGVWGEQLLEAKVNFYCITEEQAKEDKFTPELQLSPLGFNGSILHLDWYTPVACPNSEEGAPGSGDQKPDGGKDEKDKDSSGWGWFTWLFIICVLGFAVYIVGGAWINRYGSGGGVPISDIFGDLASILGDFMRKIFSLFGSGNRGGYSAV